jgi:hypothetical protein
VAALGKGVAVGSIQSIAHCAVMGAEGMCVMQGDAHM